MSTPAAGPSPVLTRELSGITPSGRLTLGNHLGALRRFGSHQDGNFYFVADLHALTTEHDPARLRERTLSTAALYLASGLDPARSTVFVQSQVRAHAELGQLLESVAHVGELGRMIQYKEKGGRPGTRASLFTYPCLMAADILLYDAAAVPVGSDQSQHVELARDVAQRFNALYGETFVVPALAPARVAMRLHDLTDPTRKMSKSAPDDAPGVIRILDTPDVVARKIRRAVTDAEARMAYDPDRQPGLANLADIVAALTGADPVDVIAAHDSYGALKQTCADAVIAELDPIRRRHDELLADRGELAQVLALGAEQAAAVADTTLRRAQAAIGLVVDDSAAPVAASTAPLAGDVVRLGDADAGEILTLQRAAFLGEGQRHGDPNLPPLRETFDELRAALADDRVIALGIRDVRGRLVAAGRAVFGADAVEIARLSVAPDRQGEGLGTRVIGALESAVAGSRPAELRIFTGALSTGNLRLYERLGYVETHRAPAGEAGGGHLLVHLVKRPAPSR